MIRKTLILFTMASTAFGTAAVASEIYKWTDEQGNVHYEDRPTVEEVERVAINSSRTNNSSVRASIDARRASQSAREEANAKREEEERKAEELAQITAEREQKCEESRARMERYLQSRRLYRENDSGEREYLDDSQVMEARSKAQEDIQAYCS